MDIYWSLFPILVTSRPAGSTAQCPGFRWRWTAMQQWKTIMSKQGLLHTDSKHGEVRKTGIMCTHIQIVLRESELSKSEGLWLRRSLEVALERVEINYQYKWKVYEVVITRIFMKLKEVIKQTELRHYSAIFAILFAIQPFHVEKCWTLFCWNHIWLQARG